MLNCNIYLSNEDCLYLDGVINFENAAEIMVAGIKLINQAKIINLDLSNLKYADSSILALLSVWIRYSNRHNKLLQIDMAPKFLLDLAKVSNLDEVLPFRSIA